MNNKPAGHANPRSARIVDAERAVIDDEATVASVVEPGMGIGKIEAMQFATNLAVEQAITTILTEIGEDPQREGLLKTPTRFARMFSELTAGYHIDAEAMINDAVFTVDYDEMVVVRDIHFYSLCEHHLLPFYGRAHVAYLPQGKVLGLSKIPRIVEMFARRLQVQERMTVEIADFIVEAINPGGVAVVAEGIHMCSVMRGVRKESASMVTSAMRGGFRTDPKTRSEFLELIKDGSCRG